MNSSLKLILIFSLFNQIFGEMTESPSKCGFPQSFFREKVNSYMDCSTESCCCQYLSERVVFKFFSSIATNNECISEMNEIIGKVDHKCMNWPNIWSKCELPNRRFVVTLRRKLQSPPHSYPLFEKHPEVQRATLRQMPIESIWYWMTVILLSVSITSLAVIIYVIQRISGKESKIPINFIGNSKQKTVPNIYSSV